MHNQWLLPPASKRWGNVLFSVCLSVHTSTGRVPHPRSGGYPHPRSGWWGYLGYPLARSGWWGYPGYPPGQVWMVGVWVPARPGLEGVPGVPPMTRTGWGTPHPLPIRQSRIASTCYVAGGMPLAFTQEDFLVSSVFICISILMENHREFSHL